MDTVTVFRQVPPPIIGMVGTIPDPTFARFEADLDWLESASVFVERFDPATAPGEVDNRPAARARLAADGDASLPLILVNGVEVSHAVVPSRSQLARAVERLRQSD